MLLLASPAIRESDICHYRTVLCLVTLEGKVAWKLNSGPEAFQTQTWHTIGAWYFLWDVLIALLLTGECGTYSYLSYNMAEKQIPWCIFFRDWKVYITILQSPARRAKKHFSYCNSELSQGCLPIPRSGGNVEGTGKPALKFPRIMQLINYIIRKSPSFPEFVLFLFNTFCKFYNPSLPHQRNSWPAWI